MTLFFRVPKAAESAPFRASIYSAAAMLLNAADAGLTLFAVRRGATEINPLMAAALAHGDGTFFAVKYALVTMGVWALWRTHAIGPLRFVVAVYACVLTYHVIAPMMSR